MKRPRTAFWVPVFSVENHNFMITGENKEKKRIIAPTLTIRFISF